MRKFFEWLKIFGRKAPLVFALLVLGAPAFSQYPYTAYRINPRPSLPATCNPAVGEVVFLTSGAGSPGLYTCVATNTWKGAGTVGNQLVLNQGTMTGASTPYLTHTATWSNAATTFIDHFVNITDTASNAASLLMKLQVGGSDRLTVDKAGNTSQAGSSTIAQAGSYSWGGRSKVLSSADGKINMVNNAGTGFTDLTLGPALSIAFPSIGASAAVGGKTQGILIYKGDGNFATFADLGAALNGSFIYCNDCTIANPCAGGGTGAFAKRLNGAWVCN